MLFRSDILFRHLQAAWKSGVKERARTNTRAGGDRERGEKIKPVFARTSFCSSSAVTGKRGCFVSLSAMRFTTSGVFTRIPVAILISCSIDRSGSSSAARGGVGGWRCGWKKTKQPRRPVRSVPQPGIEAITTCHIDSANVGNCEIARHRVPGREERDGGTRAAEGG